MQENEIEKLSAFLLSAALRKCGNLEDARDLTQDTLLAALAYCASGNTIRDMKGWLLTVLNRKFFYKLRQKYKISVVSLGAEASLADETDYFGAAINPDEAEAVRRSVAFLSKLHREVIVRFYMNGESIEKIARELNIPQGTVKSRLFAGREQIKKELDNMENYEKPSYEPITMSLSYSGSGGISFEPVSLVENDLIAQNLLYLAYQEPVADALLAKAIGIPMAYLEPIIKKLVDGELMKRVGNKIYADLRISTLEDITKHIPAQKQFIEENSGLFFQALKIGLEELREAEYFKRLNEHQQNAFELFFTAEYIQRGIYDLFHEIFDLNSEKDPDRPNGGHWTAFGHVFSKQEDKEKSLDGKMHGIGGHRSSWLDSYLEAKALHLHVFDLIGFPISAYYWGGQGIGGMRDSDIIKLFAILETGTDPEKVGFNTELLKSIPWLVKCGVLRYESDGKAAIDIPVLSSKAWESLQAMLRDTKKAFIQAIKPEYAEYLKSKKQNLPKHLEGIPLSHQYMWSNNGFVMAGIRVALKQGIIRSAYDYNCEPEERRFPYAMIFVLDK